MAVPADPSADLARLLRWENAGGSWQVRALGPGRCVVSLCRCDGGEEVERLTSTEPDLLEHLREHPPEHLGEQRP